MKYFKQVVVALSVLLLFSGTVFSEEPGPDTAKEAAGHAHAMGKEKRVVAAVDADGVQRVDITGGDYYFDPNYIVVKINKPVELRVKKADGYVPHDIMVKNPEAGIDFKTDFGSKEPAIIRFTPVKTGTYAMYCDKSLLWFKTHRERGMEGVIEVVE